MVPFYAILKSHKRFVPFTCHKPDRNPFATHTPEGPFSCVPCSETDPGVWKKGACKDCRDPSQDDE